MFTGYWNVRLADDVREIVTFRSRRGSFQFSVMPFVLNNAPAAFQRFSEVLLGDLTFVFTYVKKIPIRSATVAEHVGHVVVVLERLRDAGVKVKVKKCEFGKERINLLGHVVSETAIWPGRQKVEAIKNAPAKSSRKVLRSFSVWRRTTESF